MAWQSASNPIVEDDEDDVLAAAPPAAARDEAPARHPAPPPDDDGQMFNISTTVDPSYIISLIRKLVPTGPNAAIPNPNSGPAGTNEPEDMALVVDNDDLAGRGRTGREDEEESRDGVVAAERGDVWEECGCVLWDLAASGTHAELMVENLILDVLSTNLMVSQSVRVTEICLGIIGNLACHEGLMMRIVDTEGLVEIIVAQLFLDDTQCLCEACRLLALGLQGGESNTWAKALQSEDILCRLMWIAENALNPLLLEKIIGVVLAILESQQEASTALLPPLMKLGLPSLLITLLAFEMTKLMGERAPERYSVIDVVLRAIEALSVIDGYAQEVSTSEKLFQQGCDLIKLPDKVEVANCCITAAVLIANILSDNPHLASAISHDLLFLQGLLDIFPFASDDLEARSALWSVIARLLVQVKENEMSLSSLHQFVLALVSKYEVFEDDLLDQQSEINNEESKSSTSYRSIALQNIVRILSWWTAAKDSTCGNDPMEEENDANVGRLLDCCRKYIESAT